MRLVGECSMKLPNDGENLFAFLLELHQVKEFVKKNLFKAYRHSCIIILVDSVKQHVWNFTYLNILLWCIFNDNI